MMIPAPTGTTIVYRRKIPMNRRFKKDQEDHRDLAKEFPELCSPYVSPTHWTNSGPVIRLINQGLSFLPSEVYSFRLPDTRAQNLPAFLYKQRLQIKEFAVRKIQEVAQQNGCNFADHPSLTVNEWTLFFTTPCLTEKAKSSVGNKEAGVWVFHYPDMIRKQEGRVYEDGSREEYFVVNAHVNLVHQQYRTFTPEGGWTLAPVSNKREASQPEQGPSQGGPSQGKRHRPNNPRKWERRNDDSYRPPDEQKFEQVEIITRPSVPAPTTVNFPTLPKTQGQPGGVTPWYDRSMDAPQFLP